MNPNCTIRLAEPLEIPLLARNMRNIELSLNAKDVKLGECETLVSRMFSHPQEGRYLVAEWEGGDVVGSLLVRPEWDQLRRTMTWWINDVWVNPVDRRHGVCFAMFREVKRLAAKEQVKPTLKLIVDDWNQDAIGSYSNSGFFRIQNVMEFDAVDLKPDV